MRRTGSVTTGGSARRRVGTAVPAVLALASVLAWPGSARADQTDQTPAPTDGGYEISVSVKFTGDPALPASGRGYPVKVTCYWAPAAPQYQNAEDMLDWYDAAVANQDNNTYKDNYGEREDWEKAAEGEAKGVDVSWYRATCVDINDTPNFYIGVEGENPVVDPAGTSFVPYRTFPGGAEPPPPRVDVESLAELAWAEMILPEPTWHRNPSVGGEGGPTLVRLPTWFWVDDQDALGGPDGTQSITATVGNVSATVTATAGRFQLSSPGGGKSCGREQALTKYTAGAAPDSPACTIQFARASVAYPDGYPVQARTQWSATWEGTGEPGGRLPGRTIAAPPANVRVAEVQNVVTD